LLVDNVGAVRLPNSGILGFKIWCVSKNGAKITATTRTHAREKAEQQNSPKIFHLQKTGWFPGVSGNTAEKQNADQKKEARGGHTHEKQNQTKRHTRKITNKQTDGHPISKRWIIKKDERNP